MCETFDNNCTALHFGTVKHIDHNRHGSWSNVGDGPYLKIIRGGGTRLPKHTFHKETVYIFLPSNIQQPMCSEEGLQGHSKEALFECYLKPRRANDTHTVDTHYVGLQMQSIQMCDEKYDDILND